MATCIHLGIFVYKFPLIIDVHMKLCESHIMSSVSLCKIVTFAIQHEVFEEENDCAKDSFPREEDENTEGPTSNLDNEDTSVKEYLLCDHSNEPIS